MRDEGVRGDGDAFTKHPPVVEAFHGEGFGTKTRGDFGAHLLGPNEVIFRGNKYETRALLGVSQASTQIGHGRLGGGAIQREDAPGHFFVLASRDDCGCVGGKAQTG